MGPATYRRARERSRVAFAAVRLPRPLQNGSDRLRSRLSSGRAPPGLIAAGVALIARWSCWSSIDPFGGRRATARRRVVTIAVATDNAQQAPVGTLGFPLVATKNTTRISGPDPAADAAAAALATHPPAPRRQAAAGGDPRRRTTTGRPGSPPRSSPGRRRASGADQRPRTRFPTRPRRRWRSSTRRAAAPPATTPGLLRRRRRGPSGTQLRASCTATRPAEIADSIDQLRQRLTEAPSPSTSSWSAPTSPVTRCPPPPGRPARATRSSSAGATRCRRRRWRRCGATRRRPSTCSGRESVISEGGRRAARQGGRERAAGRRRPASVAERDRLRPLRGRRLRLEHQRSRARVRARQLRPPARRRGGGVAVGERQLGTAAAHRHGRALPPELRGFLLDIKPGYATDPTRAVYNHVWLIGDATAIGGQVQAEVDDLAELAPIGNASGRGAATGGVAQPGGVESEPNPTPQKGKK